MKERHYFSHDFFSRLDPKIARMRLDYGAEGYGIYMMLIEVLHEQPDNEYPFDAHAIAMQTQCDVAMLEQFISQCVFDYELFILNEKRNTFYSSSVKRRADERRQRSNKARESARKRWDKKCDRNAIKERKVKESKVNDHRDRAAATAPVALNGNLLASTRPNVEAGQIYTHVYLTEKERKDLVKKFPKAIVESKMVSLQEHIQNALDAPPNKRTAKHKEYLGKKDHYLTLLNWCKKLMAEKPYLATEGGK